MRGFQKGSRSRIGMAAVSFLLILAMLAMPLTAFAAQSNSEVDANVATRSSLDSLVASQVDSVYSAIKSNVSDYAGKLVYDIIGNKDAIRAFAKPIISDTIKQQLSNVNISNAELDKVIDRTVEQVVDNPWVDQVLDNEFVQAVLARTARYATADIIERLGIDADKAKIAADAGNHIWGAGLKSVGTASTKVKSDLPVVAGAGEVLNSSYFNFDVVSWNTQKILFVTLKTTPKEIKVTGWNRSNINTYLSGSVGLNAASKYNQYATTLKKMNYTEIIFAAAKRAVVDEITERLQALYQKAKEKVVAELQNKLGDINVSVSLNPQDSLVKIARDIEIALRIKAAQDIQLTVDYLLTQLLAL